ncbi:hypothetical protein [Actinomadura keratinilytica]|uniref:Uncharacterized protein n=1 Tax=Actinomadura keratinilytica TaxID=547461 RepID=A0ABP7Y565_9ACTN
MRILTVSALTVSLLATGTAVAQARTVPAAAPQARFSAITVTPEGFTAPAVVSQDAASFQVTTTDPGGAYIGLIGLRKGVSLQRYLADLEQAYDETDREAAMAGSRAVERDVVMYGGAAVLPDAPVTFTPRLRPGTYYLIDFKDVGSPGLADKVRKLRVVGHGGAVVPRAEAEIVQVQTADGPRFRAPAQLRAGAAVRVTNRSRQFNEAIFMPVREGTTRAQVGAFFAAMEGGPAAPYPFIGGPVGMVPLSPGRSTVISAELRPGTYALVTWVTDYRTGRMHAAQGMNEIITVR